MRKTDYSGARNVTRRIRGLSQCLALSVLPTTAMAWGGGERTTTNTNECVADLGALPACQPAGALGLPANIGGCCDAVRELAKDRCECNPAIDLLLGDGGDQIYDLEPLCRLIQPAKWLLVPLRPLRSCSRYRTHNYGCELNDMEVDAARLGSLLRFGTFFADAGNENMCLDTPAFVDQLATVFTEDAELFVPYGVGVYAGHSDMAEYLGLAFAGLNHGYWQFDTTVDPTKPARLEVSADGSTWHQGSTSQGTFIRGAYPYTDNYQEQEIFFEGCDDRISKYDVLPTEGLRDWVEFFVQTSDLSRRWGIEDICKYHTAFCANDPATRQYASEEECIAYMESLPLYTDACGPNRPLSGNSIGCKFKHHMMIAAHPSLHCPHIGPAGAMDPNMHLKCDDTAECSGDIGQASWPPVTLIGDQTPQSVIDLFNANNVGAETEPLGCAIPTGSTHPPHHP
jgi:hypothetical protein